MVDYIPSIITIPTYKLSTQSTISNITSEKQGRRKVNKVDEFLLKWKKSKKTIITKEKEQQTSKTRQPKESYKSINLPYMKEETSDDEESLPDLYYRENDLEFDSEEDDSENEFQRGRKFKRSK